MVDELAILPGRTQLAVPGEFVVLTGSTGQNFADAAAVLDGEAGR